MVAPDGRRIPYDDGRAKTLEDRLQDPDVEDLFFARYQPGPIRPVAIADFDPGRVRIQALLQAAYPQSALVGTIFMGQRLQVSRKVAPVLGQVDRRLREAMQSDRHLLPFLQKLGGSFSQRNIAGTDRVSAHAYGISVDINVARADYWRWPRPRSQPRWRNRIPQAIVDAFEAEGFIWGGRWYHYDTMHFEYRPELLDPSCYP